MIVSAEAVALEVAREYERARTLHAPMHSPHEGWAIIREEVDELWDLVKAYKGPKPGNGNQFVNRQVFQQRRDMRAEAVQIAAMAIRFVMDVCDNQPSAEESLDGDGDSS